MAMKVTYRGQTYVVRSEADILALVDAMKTIEAAEVLFAAHLETLATLAA